MKPIHRIVLVGDTSVGKTCLMRRLKEGDFDENIDATVSAEIATIDTNYDGKEISFNICDTAGQEKYRSLAPIYFRGASIAFIVFDITSESSFKSVETWNQIISTTSTDIKKILLIGNKRDLINERSVLPVDAQELSNRLKFANYIEVSCKSGEYITELLNEICQLILDLDTNQNCQNDLQNKNQFESGTCC